MSKREPTFAASEKMALIELVERHFSVVESKKTDAVSVRAKNEEWVKMAFEFNAVSSIHPRDSTTLKNCWENLKKRAKQQQTSRNQHFLGTGGGPPQKMIEDPVSDRVLDLIRERVSGYTNTFDSDGNQILASGSNADIPLSQDTPSHTENLLCTADASISSVSGSRSQTNVSGPIETSESAILLPDPDWSQYSTNMLREARNPALTRSRSPSPDNNLTHDFQPLSTTPRPPTPDVGPTPIAGTTRRRPTLRQDRVAQKLNTERLNTIVRANTQAEEEHAIQMNILRLQEKREEEILEQEKLKTKQEKIKLEILEIQLSKLKD